MLDTVKRLVRRGVSSKDALHVACAIGAKCDVFLTTDDGLLQAASEIRDLAVLNPADFVIGETR